MNNRFACAVCLLAALLATASNSAAAEEPNDPVFAENRKEYALGPSYAEFWRQKNKTVSIGRDRFCSESVRPVPQKGVKRAEGRPPGNYWETRVWRYYKGASRWQFGNRSMRVGCVVKFYLHEADAEEPILFAAVAKNPDGRFHVLVKRKGRWEYVGIGSMSPLKEIPWRLVFNKRGGIYKVGVKFGSK